MTYRILTVSGPAGTDVLRNIEFLQFADGTVSAAAAAAGVIVEGDVTNDTFTGTIYADVISGADGVDTLNGDAGDDIINGGAGSDQISGGTGNDTFIFYRGEAYGDTITDYNGRGTTLGDSIELRGWGTGSTFAKIAGTNYWVIHDGLDGYEEYITVSGTVDPSDWRFTQSVTSVVAPVSSLTAMSSLLLDTQGVDLLAVAPVETDLALDTSDTTGFSDVLDDGSVDSNALPDDGANAADPADVAAGAFEPPIAEAANGHGNGGGHGGGNGGGNDGGHAAFWVPFSGGHADNYIPQHHV